MPFQIYNYVDDDETVPFKLWSDGLEKTQKAKLNSKLDALYMHGEILRPEVLANTDIPSIFKLRVKGNVQLRPLLCREPNGSGYVFLVGAKEIGGKLHPKDILDKAEKYKNKLLADFATRSTKHERY